MGSGGLIWCAAIRVFDLREQARGSFFRFVPAAAQILAQIPHEIRKRRPWQGCERKRSGNLDGGKPEAGGQQTIEQTFAEPLRQFGGNAVAEHLLD